MALKFFHIASRDSAAMEAELNSFLASHRIVTVDRRFVEHGLDSFWSLCVDYLHGAAPTGSTYGSPGRSERKIDYKEVLTPEQFEVYSRLRELRKTTAEKEAIPVYAIFSNEQLAAMVQKGVKNRNDLKAIEGVGDGRVEKYGAAFLSALGAAAP